LPAAIVTVAERTTLMILLEEIRQFLNASESILDSAVEVENLTNLELEVIQYYVCEVAQKFPVILPL
jgi:hypothetical protein